MTPPRPGFSYSNLSPFGRKVLEAALYSSLRDSDYPPLFVRSTDDGLLIGYSAESDRDAVSALAQSRVHADDIFDLPVGGQENGIFTLHFKFREAGPRGAVNLVH